MSDSKIYTTEVAADPRGAVAADAHAAVEEGPAVRGKGDGLEAYASWLNRIQKTGGRHSAITRNLYSWSNYKSWADKVRGSWEEEK